MMKKGIFLEEQFSNILTLGPLYILKSMEYPKESVYWGRGYVYQYNYQKLKLKVIFMNSLKITETSLHVNINN